jgi:CheY-like chemotaxis protein
MTTILYVEDNEDNVYLMTRRLERAGYQVIVARDGLEGVRTARERRPDLIIMDLSLPELDGWAASMQLRRAPETAGIPILALSAHALSDDAQKALAAGCDDFETKPFDAKRLLAKLERLLRSSGPNGG